MSNAHQCRMRDWAISAVGLLQSHHVQRLARRFLEEALELCQALDMPKETVVEITDYVYNRPPGHVAQEAGGVYTTFLQTCTALRLDVDDVFDAAMKDMYRRMEEIKKKEAAKPTF